MLSQQLLKNQSRIVNVSCHAYLSAKMTIDDTLNIGRWAPEFHARDAFAHSKLCVILATKALSEKLIRKYLIYVYFETFHVKRNKNLLPKKHIWVFYRDKL